MISRSDLERIMVQWPMYLNSKLTKPDAASGKGRFQLGGRPMLQIIASIFAPAVETAISTKQWWQVFEYLALEAALIQRAIFASYGLETARDTVVTFLVKFGFTRKASRNGSPFEAELLAVLREGTYLDTVDVMARNWDFPSA